MKRRYSIVILVLVASVAQAGVFKCRTSNGIIYSERACPADTSAGSVRSIPAIGQQQPASQPQTTSERPAQSRTTIADIRNVDAVPLPVPANQRGAYEAFLTKQNPRAFLICKDRSVMTLFGKGNFVRNKLASLAERCAPYAIDDEVVWAGK
ncbi:MAG: DUF4124 domain-containing protein [Nitrosomonadales bacterium]|nr:DUF4124 domain-containing protein [Nitrosomonadales bacterium]